ncbi:fatty acyl-AMP ligase [Bosea sp. (in: a-proteobacteria)]|uniref:fatty acyl-AMP ligase n=1 Tax=Bosea sp. (in: a-proteobacteria) TaxID=1871050 RepID=UPI003F710D4B
MTRFSTLVDVLRYQALEKPDATALTIYADKPGLRPRLTFGELWAQSCHLAQDLSARTEPGDRALLVFPSSLEFVVSYFACLMAGVIAVPMMVPRRNAVQDASASIIADCRPQIALGPSNEFAGRQAILERLAEQGGSFQSVSLTSSPAASYEMRDNSQGLALLQYTSGSTSAPKGVMVSHGNLLSNLQMMKERLGNHAGSAHVSWIPLYHDLGLIMNLLQPIYLGAACVLLTPSGFMHRPLNWLKAIHEHRAEVGAAPNFAFDLCVDRFRPDLMEGVDLSRWKIALNGAEPVRAATLARFSETFAPYGFDPGSMRPAYGLAEATLLVSAGHRGDPARTRLFSTEALARGIVQAPNDESDACEIVSCGAPMDGLSLLIVDPQTHRPLPAGEIGEIWIQGASVAQGYWERGTQTQETFQASPTRSRPDETSGEERWLRTGDLGHLDDDGELYIVGRIKDVIIVRGVNHYPQDLEASAALSHPALRRDHTAAFSIMDDAGMERIVVVQEVERSQRHGLVEAEVVAAIQAAVVNNHDVALHQIVLIRPGALPKTTSGKVQRSLTRQLWLQGQLEPWNAARPRHDAQEDA